MPRPKTQPVSRPSLWLALAASLAAHSANVARADPSSPWGVSPSAALSYAPQAWAQDMRAIGASTVRGFHATRHLSELKPYRDANLSVSGILLWSPSQPLTLPVKHLDAFRGYVTETVSRYKGHVTNWEVWNEPPNFTVDTSAISYAKVVAAAYDTAKAVDPSVQIGLATKSVHLRYLAEAVVAGARDKFDFISLHPYEVAGLISDGCERSFLGIVSSVRTMLRDLNPKRADVPIWFSEVGVAVQHNGRSPVDEATQADLLVKIYTMALAQGVAQVDWFDPRDSEGLHLGLQRGNGEARPSYHAYKTLQSALGGTPKFLGYVSLVSDSYGFLFAGPRADALVTWMRPGVSGQLTLSGAAALLYPAQPAGQRPTALTLGATPNVLTTARGSALSSDWRQRANRDHAPWSLTAATELTMTAGEISRGVCMVNPPVVDNLATGNEFSLAGTLGAWFAVDPSFLSYAGAPIEVTLVVRGHGRGTPGFNLKYESKRPLSAANDHGMVGTGNWYFVKGTAPMAFTWQLDDASFIGKYGANLAIDCDSADHCDFSILSLKLRKR